MTNILLQKFSQQQTLTSIKLAFTYSGPFSHLSDNSTRVSSTAHIVNKFSVNNADKEVH